MTEPEIESRIVELETRLSYQDELLQVLNGVVTRQGRQLEQLDLTCRQLAERLRSAGDAVFQGTPADNVPPHY
ncbi:MAG: SlyX family protein [Nevskia sp.]|nr:SlyX family protein [Nevskia sp.]